MTKLISWLLLTCIGLMAACTVEKETGNPSGMGGKDTEEVRQEVQLTFKNKLAITQATTKAGDTPLATVAENAVTSLDVYVFASDSETGNYSFQERFAYRQNEDEFPAGSKELSLESGSKENEFTALLSLQKGLFVKLYCIANQPLLVDPANEGNAVADTYFQPLVQTTPGEAGSRVATEGVPSESLFQSFHTPLLQETAEADTLVCPLPMAGAYSLPLDLTDYSVSSRMQIGFKLTRAVARFDLVNQAGVSNFTIESISLGKGRKGSSFFPIQVYGTQPEAASGELITYPFRTFYGEKANAGVQTGAFYSYGSPSQDQGYLILKGKYRINRTEEKEVRYEVPFNQTDGNGNGAYLDIEPNHRYIVAITAADEYRLQTSITLADWQEGESVDDYTPENNAGEIIVSIPTEFAGDTEYKADSRTVSMSLKPGSEFSVSVDALVPLAINKTYRGGITAKQYDWLEVSAPAVTHKTGTTKSAPTNYGYTFSLKENYTLGRYPRATIRFTNLADGTENFFFVEAVAAPQVVEIPKTPGDTNPNSLNVDSLTASLYRITGSQVQVKIACPDGIEVESQPAWLDVEIDSQTGAETIYRLTLNNRDIAGVPDNKGTVTFRNTKVNELKTDITVRLLDASLNPLFNSSSLSGINSFDVPANGKLGNVNMQISKDNSFTVGCVSMTGIQVEMDFSDGTAWLRHTGEIYTRTLAQTNEVTFLLDENKLINAGKATVTLKNKIGGRDTAFTVTPRFITPSLGNSAVENAYLPVENNYDAVTRTLNLYTTPENGNSSAQVEVSSFGGSRLNISRLPAWITLDKEEYTATSTGCYNFTVDKNKVPATVPTPSNNVISSEVIQIQNYSDTTFYQEMILRLLSSDILLNGTPSGTNLTWDGSGKIATLVVKNGSKLNFPVKTISGCTLSVNWNGGSQWFTCPAVNINKDAQNLSFAVNVNNAYNAKQATVTLQNKLAGGADYVFYIKPKFEVATVAETSLTVNSLSGDAVKLYKGYSASVPSTPSVITLKVTSIGGSKIEVSNGLVVTGSKESAETEASYTVSAPYTMAAGKGVFIKIKNKTDESVVKNLNVTVENWVLYPKTSQPAMAMGIYWVAETDEGHVTWNEALTSCPSGWNIPDPTSGLWLITNVWDDMLKRFLLLIPGMYNPGEIAYWTNRTEWGMGIVLTNKVSTRNQQVNSRNIVQYDIASFKYSRSLGVRCIRNR